MQQAGGSQFGVPPPPTTTMTSFSTPAIGISSHGSHMLGISPSNSLQQQQQFATEMMSSHRPGPLAMPQQPATSFDELVPAVRGSFLEDDALASGEGAASGNRWPRQETLALLKIRSEMDTAFKEASLKGPLWDEVARKLADLGFKRSGKKCKEKFENVHKYYKRTKEGRAGRQDGKSYRFFTQLEALHSSSGGATAAVSAPPIIFSTPRMASPISAAAPQQTILSDMNQACNAGLQAVAAAAAAGISFSSNSSESEDDDNEEEGGGGESGDGKKQKREGSSTNQKIMAFFDGLMKQVMERQEDMQKRFLEKIEKREQDRMIREEAWRRQEIARLGHEQELLAKERAMAASRNAALISYLQNICGGQLVSPPTMPTTVVPVTTTQTPPSTTKVQQQQASPPAAVQPLQQQPMPPTPLPITQQHEISTEMVVVSEQNEVGGGLSFESGSSSRWPKAEVHALIDLRSSLDSRYHEAGPKGPLWDEISAGMQNLGYNRSAKRCKEKWENINKYFKKVKESNKRRPEDAKTCPYFHQLDALYRKKQLVIRQHQESQSNPNPNVSSQMPAPTPAQQLHIETDGNNGSKNNNTNGGNSESGTVQKQTSNGGLTPTFFEEARRHCERADGAKAATIWGDGELQ